MTKDKVCLIPDKQVLYIVQIEGHPEVTEMKDNYKHIFLYRRSKEQGGQNRCHYHVTNHMTS